MPALLIHDGYTLDATVRGLAVRYRPALPEAVFEYRRGLRGDAAAEAKATTHLLKEHLVGWDAQLRGGDGVVRDADLSAENLRRLPPPLLEGLVDLVCGYGPAQQAADQKN
jgi:hypothetical protein